MQVKTPDITLYYEKYGQGKPLILLHGNGEDHTIFKVAIRQLKKHFTIYAFDTRGHGQSMAVSQLHYQDMMNDIYTCICQLGLNKPIVYGFSDGGIVALLLAIHHPNVVSRIMISGVNTNPQGIKYGWRILFRIVYFFTKSKTMKVMLYEPDITKEQLQKIPIRVDISAGSKDMIKQKHMADMAATIPNSTFTVFEGKSHANYVIDSDIIANFIIDRCK